MVVPIGTLLAAAVVAQSSGPSANVIVAIVAVIGGIFAWRQKRGDFYKAVAEEKTAESERLRKDNEKLRLATDITPIVDTLHEVVVALNSHAELTKELFAKVADMNGSLRAHGEAMKALADHLIVGEAARGLLEAAADKPTPPTRRRRQQ